jgi:DnaJ like chaperone protein
MGKLIGGTLGFVLGGPLGAIAGAAFGHTIDRSSEIGRSGEGYGAGAGYSYGNYTEGPGVFGRMGGFGGAVNAQQRAQMTFFVGTFSMIAQVAAADGQVSEAEMEKVREFMRKDLRLDPQSTSVAERIFRAALSQVQPFEQLASQFYDEFRAQPQILELLIDILYRVAAEDGGISSQEESYIKQAARIFQFSQSRIDTIRARYAASGGAAYAVLGVSPQDSNDAIKQAYRRLVREYHPDTIASKGLPEEFTKFANEKFREIQEAYEAVRQERGF